MFHGTYSHLGGWQEKTSAGGRMGGKVQAPVLVLPSIPAPGPYFSAHRPCGWAEGQHVLLRRPQPLM